MSAVHWPSPIPLWNAGYGIDICNFKSFKMCLKWFSEAIEIVTGASYVCEMKVKTVYDISRGHSKLRHLSQTFISYINIYTYKCKLCYWRHYSK